MPEVSLSSRPATDRAMSGHRARRSSSSVPATFLYVGWTTTPAGLSTAISHSSSKMISSIMSGVTEKGRLVYSTGVGAMCPDCGWPKDNCQCSKQFDQPVPLKITAKLRMEKKGRGGKTVTVVDGLPRNSAFLKELSQELKRACGTGGAVLEGAVELQGDLRDRVRAFLEKKGYVVKG